MILAALTVLPALLGLAGRHIDSLRVPHLRRRRRPAREPVAEATEGAERTGVAYPQPVRGGAAGEGAGWERWARFISRHRWPAVILSLAVLLVLASPVLGMRLGMADDGTDPKSTTQRQAYDLLADGFGPGTNGPLLVSLDLKAGDTTTATAVQQAVGQAIGRRRGGPAADEPGRRRRGHRRGAEDRTRFPAPPTTSSRASGTTCCPTPSRGPAPAPTSAGRLPRSSTSPTASRAACCCSSARSSPCRSCCS